VGTVAAPRCCEFLISVEFAYLWSGDKRVLTYRGNPLRATFIHYRCGCSPMFGLQRRSICCFGFNPLPYSLGGVVRDDDANGPR